MKVFFKNIEKLRFGKIGLGYRFFVILECLFPFPQAPLNMSHIHQVVFVWFRFNEFGKVFFGLFFFTRSGMIKRLSFWTGILMIVISIFSFNFAARHKERISEHNFAIITQPSVTVKSSPSDSGTDLFLIHEGLKVEIRDNLGGWMEIRLSDGNQGWLPANSVERI